MTIAEIAGVLTAAGAGDRELVEGKLRALFARGLRAWPKVALGESAFCAHLAKHAAAAPSAGAFLDDVHAEDLFLACGVMHHDRAALAAFEEHFMSHVEEYVLRVRVGRDVVDEVKQKLRERLVMGTSSSDEARTEPKIAEYSGRGALGGWLRITAVRTALNQVRSAPRENATREISVDDPAFGADPELAYVRGQARELFDQAFRRVLDELAPEERAILRLHYFEGLTMDQLSELYKTPRSTIARRVAAARDRILQQTEAVLRDERGLSASVVASIIRNAQSDLRLTLTRILNR